MSTDARTWQVSRWVRLYEWDWAASRPETMAEDAASLRAKAMPKRFYYHVLRAVSDCITDEGGPVFSMSHIGANERTTAALSAARTPGDVPALIGATQAALAVSRGAALRIIQALITAGLIVRSDDPEPIDPAAVFAAARTLYGCFQHADHIEPAIALVHTHRPQTVVEIGTAWGGSLFCWAQAAHPSALLISLDLPGGEGGGGYTPDAIPHYQRFCFGGQRLVSILGDSQAAAVAEGVATALDGRPIDFLFIDGDHLYDGVRADFERYSRVVAPGGMVMFHDTNPAVQDEGNGIEVPRFWEETKGGYRRLEFGSEAESGSPGIGVLWM